MAHEIIRATALCCCAALTFGCGSAANQITPADEAGGVILTQQSSPLAQGVLISPAQVNLGAVAAGSKAPFSVELKNLSSGAITIVKIKSSCTCTNVNLDRSRLAPGEMATLQGVAQFPTKSADFRQLVTISLQGDAGSREETVQITADVKAAVGVSQNVIILSEGALQGEVVIANNSPVPFDLGSPATKDARFEPKLSRTHLDPGQTATLSVTMKTVPETLVKSAILISTSHPVEDRISVPVQFQPVLPVRLTPSDLAVGLLSKARGDLGRSLTIRVSGEALADHDLVVQSKPEFIRAADCKRRSESTVDLEVSIDPNTTLLRLNGAIRLALVAKPSTKSSKETKPIVIPFSAVIIE